MNSNNLEDYTIEKGHPYPLGATVYQNGVNFSVARSRDREAAGVVLIQKSDGKRSRILFQSDDFVGNIASVFVKGIDPLLYAYNFLDKNLCEFPDEYAKIVYGNENYGQYIEKSKLSCGFANENFDWQDDDILRIPYDESILYCLHVRGFTMHSSAKIKANGTFKGITDKIKHLQSIGITAIEIMPAYEFLEMQQQQADVSLQYAVEHYMDEPQKQNLLNYWGYQAGFYFSPKSSYAYNHSSADVEFKEMVKKLHKSDMEVIMQFYFPDEYKPGFILDVMRYWVTEYHIDGVHMKGNKIPIALLATEPLFANTKILYDYIPQEDIYELKEIPSYKNLCCYSDEFMYQMRRFLKGDEDMLNTAVSLIQRSPEKYATVNFMTNYYGFTLYDLVSYDRKHNENNKEANRDGADYNYSWNCGYEGSTKKNSVLALRKKQIKNALLLEFLSQGTPLLTGGDELLNTQDGNNNPYCQDNEITWLKWNVNKSTKEVQSFLCDIVQFRKSYAYFFNGKAKISLNDSKDSSYPCISYHADEPWKADFGNYNRHVGIMYTRKREMTENKKAVGAIDAIYIAYNMHWQQHKFVLPNLPKGQQWEQVMTTQINKDSQNDNENEKWLEERCIKVFVAK